MRDVGSLIAERTAPLLMAVINVTADSFSGDGILGAEASAIREIGLNSATAGACFLDVGGAPGHPTAPVPVDEERRRVVDALTALSVEPLLTQTVLSVDTTNASVASAAIASGAALINSIRGVMTEEGKIDDPLLEVIDRTGAWIVVSHTQPSVAVPVAYGTVYAPATAYADVVDDVCSVLETQLEILARLVPGAQARAVLDPGIGAAKTPHDNLRVLRDLGRIKALGAPVLVGHSRKSFLGFITGEHAHERDESTAIATAILCRHDVDIFRVHNVARNATAIRLAAELGVPDRSKSQHVSP